MTRVYVMLGGFSSIDSYLTSSGLLLLEKRLAKLPGLKVEHHIRGSYLTIYNLIQERKDKKVAMVCYSGSAAEATWIANGYVWGKGFVQSKPSIDLIVGYDPSPPQQMISLKNTNVKRAICYYNEPSIMNTLLNGGLGSGKFEGPQVEIVKTSGIHLGYQWANDLHDRTVREICAL